MKKRWFAFILIVIIGFGLTACNNDSEENVTQKVKDGLSMTATMQYNGQKMEALFKKGDSGEYQVEVVSPSYIKGMIFTFKETGTTVSYMGMTMDLEGDGLLAATMSKAIISSVNSVASETGISVTAEDKNYIIDGENENGAFQMALDKKSKLPTHLSIPSLGLECDLKKD